RSSSGGDLVAQYRLDLTLADTQAPSIIANSLPAEGTLSTDLFDRFTLTFSEDMDASTVNNVANYSLRAAGPDGSFDTADDVDIPLVLTSSYSSGISVGLRTANGGAFAVGSYRFRALPALKDRYGN